MATVNLLFEHPHDLILETRLTEVKIKGDRFKVLLKETIAENENPEGGDWGTIVWEGGHLVFDRVYTTPTGDIWHEGILNGLKPDLDVSCRLEIDPGNRLCHSGYHSFSHLLTAVALQKTGKRRVGVSQVFSDHGVIYLKQDQDSLTLAQEIWEEALTYLHKPDPVDQRVMSRELALSIVGDFYQNVLPLKATRVKIVKVGYDLPWIPCRGVHLRDLSAIRRAVQFPKLSPWAENGDLVFNYQLTLIHS